MRVRVRERGTTVKLTEMVPYAVDRWNGTDWLLWSVYRSQDEAMEAAHDLEQLEVRPSRVIYETPT